MKTKTFYPATLKQLLKNGFHVLSVKRFIMLWHKIEKRDALLTPNYLCGWKDLHAVEQWQPNMESLCVVHRARLWLRKTPVKVKAAAPFALEFVASVISGSVKSSIPAGSDGG
jgi:hypothetical protein